MALTAAQARAAATAQVEKYSPAAPDAIKTAAVERMADFLLIPVGIRQAQESGNMVTYASGPAALTASGAAALLAPWRAPRALPATNLDDSA